MVCFIGNLLNSFLAQSDTWQNAQFKWIIIMMKDLEEKLITWEKLNEHWDIQGFINIKVKKLSKVSHSRSNTTVNIVE